MPILIHMDNTLEYLNLYNTKYSNEFQSENQNIS